MDYFERTGRQEAKVDYLSGNYQIITPGSHVRCAVTKNCIALDELKYWNVEHQEAYIDARISCEREEEFKKQG